MSNIGFVAFLLSQFYGLCMVIIAFVMFIRVNPYRRLIKKMDPESGTILLGSMVGLVFGLFFVGVYNIWSLNSLVLVTIIGWMILVVSLLWLGMPEHMAALHKKIFLGKGYYIFATLLGLWGIIFLTKGVYTYATHHREFTIIEYFFK